MTSMYDNVGCSAPIVASGDEVKCWASQNSTLAVAAESTDNGGTFNAAAAGLQFDGSVVFTRPGVWNGEVDDVTIFVVQTEISRLPNAYTIMLNYPAADEPGAYTAALPDGPSRTLIWDAGNNSDARTQTTPDLIGVGEKHLIGLTNSVSQQVREITIDGSVHALEFGGRSSVAGTFALGFSTDAIYHEVRIYTPSPRIEEYLAIEGELACKWGLQDALPKEHPFASGMDGCPSQGFD